jgi:hypothetical protein
MHPLTPQPKNQARAWFPASGGHSVAMCAPLLARPAAPSAVPTTTAAAVRAAPQYVDALRELLYDLEASPADAPGPDVLSAYKQHVAWLARELRPPEVGGPGPFAGAREGGGSARALRGSTTAQRGFVSNQRRAGCTRPLVSAAPLCRPSPRCRRCRKQVPAFCRRVAAGDASLAAAGDAPRFGGGH